MFEKHIKFRVRKTNITKFAKRKTTSKSSFKIINKTKIKITLILHMKRLTLKSNTTRVLIVFDTVLCRKMKRNHWCLNSNSRWELYNKNLTVIYTAFIRKIKRNSLKSYSAHLKKISTSKNSTHFTTSLLFHVSNTLNLYYFSSKNTFETLQLYLIWINFNTVIKN